MDFEYNTWQLRSATSREINQWDDLIAANPDGGNFLQTSEFTSLKTNEGWKQLHLIYANKDTVIAAVALRRYIFPLGELWYFPKGPCVDASQLTTFYQLTLRYIVDNNFNVFLVQMEPESYRKSSTLTNLFSSKNIISAEGIQAHTSTVIVPLGDSTDTLFSLLSKRARYGIRVGLRDGIVVKSVAASEENFRCMYELMKTVSGGRGVGGIRPYTYYRRFWQTYMASNKGSLYFAYENDTPVVGAFVIIIGKKAFYKDGGSCPMRQSKGASYLMQWQIIQDMKDIGVKTYDMLGTPPSQKRRDTKHPLYGVGLFKTAFSQEIIDYGGVLNIILSPYKYKIWSKYIYPLTYRVERLNSRYFY